jgi:hypothetical protein
MEHSVLNTQQSRLANRSLYFVLGLLSLAKNLENRLDSVDNPQVLVDSPVDEGSNHDFLYFTLGALALSNRLQAKLEVERELVAINENEVISDTLDDLKNLLY